MEAHSRRLVALLFGNQVRLAAEIRACWDEGTAVLPLDPRLPPAERARSLAAAGPQALRDEAGERELGEATPAAADLAAVVLTSGSRGAPKAVELGDAALDIAADISNRRLGAARGDRWLCCLPLWHIAGLGTLRRAAALGSDPIVVQDLDEVTRREAELVSLVPTQLRRLLDRKEELARFKAVLVGGGPMPAALIERAAEAGARIVVSYGMTETSGGVVYDGVPLDGVTIELDDAGTIVIHTPTLMSGYRGAPQETASVLKRGAFVTADIGRWNNGRLEVLGRADDVIVTGGEKVVPGEVAALLLRDPRIEDAVVLGAPDPEWGERVVAVIQPVAGEEVDPARLRERLQGELARHKVPKEIRVMAALPRTALAKTDMVALRAALSGEDRGETPGSAASSTAI